MSSQATNSYFR